MFTQLLGKTIAKYYNVNSVSEFIKLPTIIETINTLTINFIIGSYGSQNMKFIEMANLNQ